MANEYSDALKQLMNDPFIINYVDSIIKDNFDQIKEDILNQFNSHPVTLELEGGISASNISGTLNGVTNLYSFIGFENGDKPTEPIREILSKSNYSIKKINSSGIINITFDIPTADSIFKITPMPWADGRSWAKGIETGISGLGYYIKKIKNSRSGLGVQSQTQVRSARFNNTKYISALINDFNVKIKGIEKIQL